MGNPCDNKNTIDGIVQYDEYTEPLGDYKESTVRHYEQIDENDYQTLKSLIKNSAQSHEHNTIADVLATVRKTYDSCIPPDERSPRYDFRKTDQRKDMMKNHDNFGNLCRDSIKTLKGVYSNTHKSEERQAIVKSMQDVMMEYARYANASAPLIGIPSTGIRGNSDYIPLNNYEESSACVTNRIQRDNANPETYEKSRSTSHVVPLNRAYKFNSLNKSIIQDPTKVNSLSEHLKSANKTLTSYSKTKSVANNPDAKKILNDFSESLTRAQEYIDGNAVTVSDYQDSVNVVKSAVGTAKSAADESLGSFQHFIYGFCKMLLPKAIRKSRFENTARYKVDEVRDAIKSEEPPTPGSTPGM